MEKKELDVILNPVRMRIIMALAGRELTPQQIAEELRGVPQATLYRHINRLAEAGVINVAAERPVRGTTEKVYTLNPQGGQVTPDDLSQMSKDDHMRGFNGFMTTLLDQFARYLQSREKVDLAADGVGYRIVAMELSDEELGQMAQALNQALLPFLQNPPAPGRQRRLFSTVLLPDVDRAAPEK